MNTWRPRESYKHSIVYIFESERTSSVEVLERLIEKCSIILTDLEGFKRGLDLRGGGGPLSMVSKRKRPVYWHARQTADYWRRNQFSADELY